MTDFNAWNQQIIAEFRANGGVLGGDFTGDPVLLLHTNGAKSGAERVNPMMYLEVGDSWAVFASKGGAPSHPDWYHNLVAHPKVVVEMGTEAFDAARVAEGDERSAIWERQKSSYAQFADYEARTDRVIPVVLLERIVA